MPGERTCGRTLTIEGVDGPPDRQSRDTHSGFPPATVRPTPSKRDPAVCHRYSSPALARGLLLAAPESGYCRTELTSPLAALLARRGDRLLKGGDPAAPSGTATLLRLHPSCWAHLGHRRPCSGSASDFRCTKLKWCDGRCVQGPGTYSPQYADLRLLATPSSCRRVAACNLN